MPDDRIPSTVPTPNYEVIRAGGAAGQEELVVALRNVVNALNQYIVRKGA